MIQDIKTKNIKSRIRERIKDFTSKLMEQPEVEGIVYLGGLANTDYKDFIDEFSDIDLGIFINTEQNNLPTWLQPFSFYIPVVDENGNENIMEVNLHQQILSEERKCEWADTKREAYAYASEVIFDRNGEITDLIKEKTKLTPHYRKKFLAHLLSRINWSVKINPIKAVKRGFELNAEELLNQGMENMLDLLFVYNHRYPPHPKWKLAMIENLQYCPENIKAKIAECMKIEEISKEDIMRRRSAILEIVTDIEQRLDREGLFREDEEYSDYEYIYWSPQKQLKKQTIYDDISSMFPNLSQQDKKIFKGLLCEYFVQNLDEIYEIPRDALEKKYKDIIDKIIYQDPQTKKLIADFVRAYKTNNKEGIEIALKALRKRKIEIITKDDGKFDIKKIDTISKKNDELYK